jgi:cytochrome c
MYIYTSVAAALLLSIVCTLQEQNSEPKVAISVQANTFKWNSIVPYTIAVSDAEDGKTEYNEIPSHEVLLVANYLPDSTIVNEKLFDHEMIRHHDAVLALSKALCFNCHAAKANVIGPSFEEVAARYKDVSDAEEFLTKRIIEGSTGHWSVSQQAIWITDRKIPSMKRTVREDRMPLY